MASEAAPSIPFNPVHPDWYAEHGYPHDFWTRLRREDPVHRWEKARQAGCNKVLKAMKRRYPED